MTETKENNVVTVEEEEQRLLIDEEFTTVLDFDMLCSTVAMQVQEGKWVNLNNSGAHQQQEQYYNNGNGNGVFRMWEGELVYDCFEDPNIALQSACCPCYRFGKNMKRAGFGSCFFQGFFHLILLFIALFNLIGFLVTRNRCFLYLAAAFTVSIGTYAGFYRVQMRKKFNIKGSDSCFDDCVYHLICPCCTMCQESRTLEMNNVHDGIWNGRGDTICVGKGNLSSKSSKEMSPAIVSTQSPEIFSMQKSVSCDTDR